MLSNASMQLLVLQHRLSSLPHTPGAQLAAANICGTSVRSCSSCGVAAAAGPAVSAAVADTTIWHQPASELYMVRGAACSVVACFSLLVLITAPSATVHVWSRAWFTNSQGTQHLELKHLEKHALWCICLHVFSKAGCMERHVQQNTASHMRDACDKVSGCGPTSAQHDEASTFLPGTICSPVLLPYTFKGT